MNAPTETLPGTYAMATRLVNAERRFLAYATETAGCTDAQAERILAYYLKHKLVKLDAVDGQFHVKHGVLLDADVMRNAITA